MTTASQVEPARYRDDRPPHRRNQADVQIALTRVAGRHVRALSQNEKFHRHVSGLHIRDYHLLLHEQATQILATTDITAECVHKLGGQTINSIGHIGRLEQIQDNNAAEVAPREMLTELLEDNRLATEQMRKMHALCDEPVTL